MFPSKNIACAFVVKAVYNLCTTRQLIERLESDPQGRMVPILDGEMRDLLTLTKRERDENWPDSLWVFNRRGEQIRDMRWAWREACRRAGVPELKFHDLRRTAVRNMRRDGVPQVVRMKITGHKTDSMERRYNIVGSA